MSFPKPSTIRLYHFTRPPVSDWTDITSSGSPNGTQVCGTSATLGTFAIFYPQVPETADSDDRREWHAHGQHRRSWRRSG